MARALLIYFLSMFRIEEILARMQLCSAVIKLKLLINCIYKLIENFRSLSLSISIRVLSVYAPVCIIKLSMLIKSMGADKSRQFGLVNNH